MEIDLMWEQIRSSTVPLPGPMGWQGEATDDITWIRSGKPTDADVLIVALHGATEGLLRDWPRTLQPTAEWRQLPTSAGAEDVNGTLRRWANANPVQIADRLILQRAMIVRWIETPEVSGAVSLYAEIAADQVESGFGLHPGAEETVALLRRVAAQGRPGSTVERERDPSSLPLPFRHFILACLMFLESLPGSSGHRPGMVRMPEAWRLYEAWVAASCLAIATDALGPPLSFLERTRECWTASWEFNDQIVKLDAQPSFSDDPLANPSESLHSVTFRLNPDVTLRVIRGSSTERLAVLDAKLRGTGFAESDAAAGAAKYLWALRGRDGQFPDFRVDVAIVSPTPLKPPSSPDKARMAFLHHRPMQTVQLASWLLQLISEGPA